MKVLTKMIPAFSSTPGIDGHGEGAEYENKTYYYPRKGKSIPRDRAVHLTWEGNYMGRSHGEKEHILVCYNDKGELLFLKVVYRPSEEIKRYKGMSNSEVIAKIENEKRHIDSIRDAMPKCSSCGETAIVLEDNQPSDKCLSCFKKGL